VCKSEATSSSAVHLILATHSGEFEERRKHFLTLAYLNAYTAPTPSQFTARFETFAGTLLYSQDAILLKTESRQLVAA